MPLRIWAVLFLSAQLGAAGVVNAVYYFNRPVDGQNQNIAGGDITGFSLTMSVVGSNFGMNAAIKDPDFRKLGGPGIVGNEARNDTTDGLNSPKLESDPQMQFDSSSVANGALDNRSFPNGIKYTLRADDFTTKWDTRNEVKFGPANALRFGYALSVDNKVFQQNTFSLKDAHWTANGQDYAAKGMNTVSMGKRNSYGFHYTNDLSTSILLYGLIFEMRLDYLASEQLDPYASLGGIPFSTTPFVTIDGVPVPVASSYSLGPGSNIDFDFPGDYESFTGYVTMQGQVSSAGSDMAAFAYLVDEVPEPSTFLLLGAGLMLIRFQGKGTKR
ncbi:MAG: PEP-CTERM sorting domain-containing protein [Bryobacteraceae bacterium]